MRNAIILLLAVGTLAGCNAPRLAAFQQCEHDHPRTSTTSPLLAVGAIGGAIAGSLDDPTKPARDACYQQAIAAN